MSGKSDYYISVHHLIPTLPDRIGNIQAVSKQISKLCFHLSIQVYSLLGQSEEAREAFLESARRGTTL